MTSHSLAERPPQRAGVVDEQGRVRTQVRDALHLLAGPRDQCDRASPSSQLRAESSSTSTPAARDGSLALAPGVDDSAVRDPQHAHSGLLRGGRLRGVGSGRSLRRHLLMVTDCHGLCVDAYGKMTRRPFPAAGETSVQFRDFLGVLRARWRTIAACALIVLGATAAYTLTLTPSYTATARIYFSATCPRHRGHTSRGASTSSPVRTSTPTSRCCARPPLSTRCAPS